MATEEGPVLRPQKPAKKAAKKSKKKSTKASAKKGRVVKEPAKKATKPRKVLGGVKFSVIGKIKF